MGSMQVIGRERVEDQNNRANQAQEQQNAFMDAVYKYRQLQFYGAELKMKAKQTENEAEKLRLSSQADTIKLIADAMKNSADIIKEQGPEAGRAYMAGIARQFPQIVPAIQPFMDKIGGMRQGGEERIQSQIADSPVFRKSLGYNNVGTSDTDIPGAIPSQVDNTIPEQTNTQAQIGALNGEIPTQSENIGTLPGYGLSPEIGIDAGPVSMKLVNQQALYDIEANKAAAAIRGEKLEGKPVSDKTVDYIAESSNTVDTLSNTLTSLLNNPRFQSKMGPLAMMTRAGVSFLDPTFAGFSASARDAFSQYRKLITGAQASNQELQWLEGILGSVERDSYDTFLVKNFIAAKLAAKKIANRVSSEKAAYKDTRTFDELQAKINAMLIPIEEQISERNIDVKSLIGSLNISDKDKAIAKGVARGNSYEESLNLYIKWLKSHPSGGK